MANMPLVYCTLVADLQPIRGCATIIKSNLKGMNTLPRLFARHKRLYCTSFVETATIYALSSGKGKSGVAVIRVSGPKTKSIITGMINPPDLPKPRYASLRTICDPCSKEKLDKGLILWFPGPYSFTGEDLVEFHIHGGQAVVRAVFNALRSLPDTRPADPGEFTKRAFINGKMDLTEAEGVADLIHAETEAQRRQALRQMEGSLSKKYANWRERLLKAVAFLEAVIDFSEEEQLEPDIINKVVSMVSSVEKELKDHLSDHRRGERLRDGVHVTIVGEPNVGKSSLLNALCQRPAAIVSPIAGTTRDIVESAFDLGGYPILLSDTAGLRSTDDLVESEGVRRAVARAISSDVIILVLDASRFVLSQSPASRDDIISSELSKFGFAPQPNQRTFLIFNKVDLADKVALKRLQNYRVGTCYFISCVTGGGIDDFLVGLVKDVEELCGGNQVVGEASLTQQRHRSNLEVCQTRLENFWQRLQQDDIPLAAHELQQALRQIGKITGKIYIEEVLDVIFRDFCIGK